MTTILAFLATIITPNVITQIIKKTLARYSDTKIHLVCFLVCFAGAGVFYALQGMPNVLAVLKHAAEVFVQIALMAIGFYEVVWKQLAKLGKDAV